MYAAFIRILAGKHLSNLVAFYGQVAIRQIPRSKIQNRLDVNNLAITGH